jgi:hypothetical protein
MDTDWLRKCNGDNMPIPPFERYIHILPFHVVKRRLCPGELGYRGCKPDFYTLPLRDDNEISAIELVRRHTDIPVPKLIYRENGLVAKYTRRSPPRWTNTSENVGSTSLNAFKA